MKVQGIIEYRNAKWAVELFNGGKEGREQLAKQPYLMDLLLEIHRAQGAETMTMDEMMSETRSDNG